MSLGLMSRPSLSDAQLRHTSHTPTGGVAGADVPAFVERGADLTDNLADSLQGVAGADVPAFVERTGLVNEPTNK